MLSVRFVLLYIIITTLTFLLFFFNDTATTEIYTLSLHDALPICRDRPGETFDAGDEQSRAGAAQPQTGDARLRYRMLAGFPHGYTRQQAREQRHRHERKRDPRCAERNL